MINGIDVVFIHVRNPTKMAKWYKEMLEIEMDHAEPDLSWQEFELDHKQRPTRFALDFGGESQSEVERQPIMISFGVDDLYTVVESLEDKGIEFYGESKIMDVGPSLFATFQDPEGNWIQLSQRK